MVLPAVLQTPSFLALWECAQNATLAQDPEVIWWQYIDTIDATVLPHLSEQLHVEGFKGWFLTKDDELKQRNLLKKALYLHSKAGTIEAIRCALEVLGYPAISIVENPPNFYDGEFGHDETIQYSGKRWSQFLLEFIAPPPAEDLDLLYELIFAWKPERSHLVFAPNRFKYDETEIYNGVQFYTGYKL